MTFSTYPYPTPIPATTTFAAGCTSDSSAGNDASTASTTILHHIQRQRPRPRQLLRTTDCTTTATVSQETLDSLSWLPLACLIVYIFSFSVGECISCSSASSVNLFLAMVTLWPSIRSFRSSSA